MNMTWKEFKAIVEKKLTELGVDENVEIVYMDFSYPSMDIPDDPKIMVDEFGLVVLGR